jgi:hypothetical protein
MDKPFFDEEPGIEGPDYVALVIEWDQLADAIQDELIEEPTRPIRKPPDLLAIVAGVLGAVALVIWGARRLRSA